MARVHARHRRTGLHRREPLRAPGLPQADRDAGLLGRAYRRSGNPGGLLESKKISDHADLYYIWTACHNPASPVGTIASCHAAAAMRDFRIHELANWVDWWPDSGGALKSRFGRTANFTIQDKASVRNRTGIRMSPKAHLAPGETCVG